MSKKILLVEDDPLARKAMDTLISRHPRLLTLSPQVIHAASGQQGLALFVAERPDLVITDLFMPAMDGFALCRAIREAPFGKDVPLVVMSGIYKDPALEVSLREELQALFLPKPLPPEALADTILGCLGLGIPVAPNLAVHENGVVALSYQEHASTGVAHEPVPAPPMSGALGSAAIPAQSEPLRRTLPGLSPGHAPTPSRSGSLDQHHVARLLFDFADGYATGTLSLTRGKIRKDFYLRKGEVVAADSNLRQEALGTLLCGKGIIDEAQLAYLLAETKARGQKMGMVLVELGWMTPAEVLDFLAAQARKRVVDALRWDSGAFAFVPGDTFGERIIEHQLDMVRTVFQGLYRSATPEFLVRRFDQDGARPVELSQRFDRYRNEVESLFNRDISLLLAHAPTVGTLALREDAHQVMATVDVLLETGLAQLGYASENAEPTNVMDALESSFSLERLGMEVADRIDAIVLQDPNVAFGEVGRTSPAPLSADLAHSKAVEISDSGAIDIGLGPMALDAPRLGEATHPESLNGAFHARLMRDYLMLHGRSHYDLLGIATTATTAEVLAAVQDRLLPYAEASVAGLALSPEEQAKVEAVRAVFSQAGKVLSDPALREAYDAPPVDSRQAPEDPLSAELSFGEAMQLLEAGRTEEAIPKFQAAVKARPDQALYHAQLALAEYLHQGATKLPTVNEHLDHALALDPDLAEAHALRGRIAADRGEIAEARACLEKSLMVAAAQPDTLALWLKCHSQDPLPDPKASERFLKNLVSALGDRLEPLRKQLWVELGKLYETTLDNQAAARIAYDTAAKLLPRDTEVLRKASDINAGDPNRWRETVRSLVAEWQLHSTEREIPLRLLRYLQAQGKDDEAILTATAMVLRGVATPDEERLAEEGRPKTLQRLTGTWNDSLRLKLGYAAEEQDLEDLLSLLCDLGIVPGFAKEDIGVDPACAPIPEGQLSPAFRRVLRYMRELFQLSLAPSVFEVSILGQDARSADLRPMALLCGPAALASQDPVELGFRLGRALSLAVPGRLAAASRTGTQLRPYFIETLALLTQKGPSREDPTTAALWNLEPTAQNRVKRQAHAVFRRQKKLNLSRWIRSLTRTANRQGLICSGDMMRVGRAILEEEGVAALDEFLLFALSPEHFDLRRDLGLGIV